MRLEITTRIDLLVKRDRQALRALLDAFGSSEEEHYVCHGKPDEEPKTVMVWTSEGNEELARSQMEVADDVEQVKIETVGGQTQEVDLNAVKKELAKVEKAQKKRSKAKSQSIEPTPMSQAEIDRCHREEAEMAAEEPPKKRKQEELSTLPKVDAAMKKAVEEKRSKAAEIVDELKKELAKGPEVEVENDETGETASGTVEEVLDQLDPPPPDDGEAISKEDAEELRKLRVQATKLQVFPKFRAILIEEHGKGGKFEDIPAATAALILPRVRELIEQTEQGVVEDEPAK